MRCLAFLLLAAALPAACRPTDPADSAPPPTSAVAPIAGARLADALQILDRELVSAINKRLEGEGLQDFVRAEAVSDRLLETQYPFSWLSNNYSLDAKLRQIQALADRVAAQLTSGAPTDTILGDLRRLRKDVVWLRQALAQGGGNAPPSLERLLAGRDTLTLFSGEGVGGE